MNGHPDISELIVKGCKIHTKKKKNRNNNFESFSRKPVLLGLIRTSSLNGFDEGLLLCFYGIKVYDGYTALLLSLLVTSCLLCWGTDPSKLGLFLEEQILFLKS